MSLRTNRLRFAALALVLATALLATCSACTGADSGHTPSADAAAETGVRPDASNAGDASGDEGVASDAGEADAPIYGHPALPDFTKGWTRAAWATDCTLYEAGDTQLTAIAPIAWQPCVGGRASCRELPHAASDAVIASDLSLSTDGTQFAVRRSYSAYQDEIVVADASTGVARAAWRSDGPSCLVAGRFDGTFGLTAMARTPDKRIARYLQVAAADPTALRGRATPDASVSVTDAALPGALVLSRALADDALFVWVFAQANAAAVIDRSTGKPLRLLDLDSGAAVVMTAGNALAGDALLFSSGHDVFAWTRGNATRTVIAGQDGTAVPHDVVGDGTVMAWLESSTLDAQGFFTGSTLYASPWATDAAHVQRRRVVDIGCPHWTCGVRFSAGYLTAFEWNRVDAASWSLAVVRLDDGTRWTLPHLSNSAGGGFVREGEVWMPDTERIMLGAPDP